MHTYQVAVTDVTASTVDATCARGSETGRPCIDTETAIPYIDILTYIHTYIHTHIYVPIGIPYIDMQAACQWFDVLLMFY